MNKQSFTFDYQIRPLKLYLLNFKSQITIVFQVCMMTAEVFPLWLKIFRNLKEKYSL